MGSLLLSMGCVALSVTSYAQSFFNKNCNHEQLEAIITAHQGINSAEKLNAAFSQIIEDSKNSAKKECVEIIRVIMLAEIAAKKSDNLNQSSHFLYEKAVQLATAKNDGPMLIWASINYAFYLYTYRDYENALPHFIKTGQLLETVSDKSLIFAGDTYKKMGYFTGFIKEYEKGIMYLKKAAEYTPARSSQMGNILDNTGMLYLQNDQPVKAREYFDKALEVALKIKDTLRQAKVLGNIAALYKYGGQLEKSIDLLYRDIELSRSFGNDMNTMFALLRLGEVYLEAGRLNLAQNAAFEADAIARSKTYFKGSELEAAQILLQVSQRKNDAVAELALRRKIDSLNAALNITGNNSLTSRLNTEAQKEIFNLELNREKERVDKVSTTRNMVIAVALILFVIGLTVFFRQHKQGEKISGDYQTTLTRLQGEHEVSEARLQEANNSLAAYLRYLSEKNIQIQTLEQELEKIKIDDQSGGNKKAIDGLLQSHLMTDENWNLFKNAFAKEHSLFYKSLINNYPGLTEANLRIILLQKLGLSNGDTANLLGITVDAVKKAKQRLRKKLNGQYDVLVGMALTEDE